MQQIKVLIVDDSLFMRNSLKKILDVEQVKVIDIASNGKEGVEKNIALNPDVILMDVEMPVMNGIDALKEIMATNPVPVLMFSKLTQDGAKETLEALAFGAVDFITKVSSYFDLNSVRDDLLKKIIAIGSNTFLRKNLKAKYANAGKTVEPKEIDSNKITKIQTVRPNYQTSRKRPNPSDIKVVCIGISTGGPAALHEVIPEIPNDIPVSILVVQHMPPLFTDSLAKRLDQASALKVVEAKDGDELKPGVVYIAKGGMKMTVTQKHTLSVSNTHTKELFKPSVNDLVSSVVDVFHEKAVGIIMTGMGNDGRDGLSKLAEAGGYVIAQEPETCVVAGMPRAVLEAKIAHEIQPLHRIAGTIFSLFNNTK